MTSQQAVFADTIACMKKAIKRKAYDSDSDTSIDRCTNRTNKLRKKARFVHEGQLARPCAPQVYRRTIEHAGYQRDILYQNPPLIDEDGYEIGTDDDDERTQAAEANAAQLNPYAQVKLENILAPLTAASGLPNHPTLSKPFTSQTLTQLTQQARDMVQKEKSFLWKLKHLMTRMSGDNTWIPCHIVEGENDWALFFEKKNHCQQSSPEKPIIAAEKKQTSPGKTLIGAEKHSPDSIIAAVKQLIAKKQRSDTSHFSKSSATEVPAENTEGRPISEPPANTLNHRKSSTMNTSADSNQETENLREMANNSRDCELTETHEQTPVLCRMRMRTRAQAQADSKITRTRSLSPETEDDSFIHPYFLAAQSSRPDRNLGLPHNEAAETRKVLQLYIQKQEEVCRGIQRIYDGLLKADRYRKLIVKWAKADGHVGVNRDMSDGEDWYDNEEWNLDEDLKKGQDEEEEDAATTAKKTRARRQ
ncbi:hypothetical protein K3495_g4155 [Podosphaera aphanis]|nr:hypothetical protein K3495_g4155 [Podosphaera aphanis]